MPKGSRRSRITGTRPAPEPVKPLKRPIFDIPRRKAFQIAGIYALIAAVWVFLSDRLIGLFIQDLESCLWLQTAKGWFYVLATAGLLYLLVLRGMRSFEHYEEQIHRRDEALQQAQKMEAVGRLAGGVAHDFNNHLMVIAGYTQLLKEQCNGNPRVASDLEQIEKACRSGTQLTQQLLTFSRKHTLKPQAVDLNLIVSLSEKMLRRLIGENVIIELNLAEHACPIEIDPVQLEQIIMNLAVNAKDAMPRGGRFRLSTYVVSEDQAPQSEFASAQVLLEVSDTGDGMEEEVLAHIFEPFYTTKKTGKGTGLGLATVYGIVEQAGGRIEVKSVLEQGTTFLIWFPMTDKEPQWSPAKRSRPALAGRDAQVLLVEDERGVAELTAGILEAAGYRVLWALDGSTALEIAGGEEEVDLLLADVVLPGLSGPELARELRRRRPGLKVLFMSGYAEKELLEVGGAEDAFLEKPASPSQILDAVASVLAEEEDPAGSGA